MKKKLRILELCTSRSWGGMEMRVLKTARELKQNGHDVVIVCYPDCSLHKAALNENIMCKTFPFKGGLHLVLISRLRKYIKETKFDVIHCQYSRDLRFIVPAIEGMKPRIPLMFTKRLGSYIKKKDFIHKYLFSRVDLVTTISNVIRQNVIDTCPVEPEKVEVLHNGIDSNIYQIALSNRDQKREEEKIQNEIVIGVIGRFSPGKGHEEFLEAAKIICSMRSDVKFWLIGNASFGEDEYGDQIIKLANDPLIKDSVRILGFRNDIPELLSAIDILTVPSHAEAFGNVAIEGMASAKPLVASNTDGLLDIVVDNETGFQVPPKNPEALAAALVRLINDKELRKKMGEAGYKRVVDKFDTKKQYSKLEEKLYSLTEKLDK